MRAQDGAVGAGGGEVEGREVPDVGGVLADGDLGEVVLVVRSEAAVDALAEVEEEAYEELQAGVAEDAHGDGVDAVLGDEVGLPDEALEEEAEEEALGLLLGLGVLLEGAVDDGRVGEGGEDDGLELGAPGAALEGGAALLELEGVAVLLNEARQHRFLSLFLGGLTCLFFSFLAVPLTLPTAKKRVSASEADCSFPCAQNQDACQHHTGLCAACSEAYLWRQDRHPWAEDGRWSQLLQCL